MTTTTTNTARCERCGNQAWLTQAGWRHTPPNTFYDGHCVGTGLWPRISTDDLELIALLDEEENLHREYRMALELERGRRRHAIAYSARCSFPGCESAARPNPADTENGPNAHDLDPVLCAYHEDELWLIANLEGDMAGTLTGEALGRYMAPSAPAPYASPTAWHRHEDEPCQRGTIGCSVDHLPEHPDGPCETW